MVKYQVQQPNVSSEWIVRPVWEERARLAREVGVGEIVAQLLYNRGIADAEQARRFLQPSLNDLIDPHRLIGVAPAVKRIQKALREGEKILLYGDYDVDGIAGVAILWQCLKLAGTEVEYYVPHRIEEGYGLNGEAIEQLAKKGARLIVTVDCGITAVEEAQVAAELGVDLIITDHHKPEAQLPQAHAIVHPNIEGQDYPNPHLCGTAVAFKLAWALAQELSGSQKVSPEFREFLLNATGLVALGTIADVVPLVGENRVLARFGLEGLAQSQDVGVMALIKASRLTGETLESADIGFKLAPRINAAGRMGHARLAVELFTKSNPARAQKIAAYLESQNNLRKKVEKETTAEAIEQVASLNMVEQEYRGMVLAGENWHGGVVGIVASRIVDKFHCPTVVISIQEGQATGSCRSIAGFDVVGALEHCSDFLVAFGGHAMAAGLTIEPDQIDSFRRAFNDYAQTHMAEEVRIRKLEIDAEVSPAEMDLKMVEMINRLAPFGQGNPPVLLVARGLTLIGPPRRMGKKGEHLQMIVADKDDPSPEMRPGGMIRAVGFGKAQWEKKLLDAESFDLVFEPQINRFNGSVTVEMIARDIIFT